MPQIRERLAAVLGLLLVTGVVLAYPTPSAVPTRWELTFKPGDLRLYIDPADNQPYWYFNYTVTNRTGRDQVWAPQFVLFTDAGEILSSGEGVPLRVTQQIMSMLGNPLLLNQYEIIGDVLQGREHEKDGVVVWPARNLNLTEMSLFISGISGETARYVDPHHGDSIILRKTLQIDYLVPGSPAARGSRPVEQTEQRWIFR